MAPSWLRGDPIYTQYSFERPKPPPGDGKHWERCRRLMTKYDDGIADDWKQEIQNQLLVSTLLSAVTAAFLVETQKELYEDPTKTSALALVQILNQLNQSASISTTIQPFSSPDSANEIINAFWFASLALSLSTATIGLLCLQWIQEYKKDANYLKDEKYFDVRHFRNVAFERRGAKVIISVLPVLLILSLVTFFGGLLAFLGTLSWTVATPVYAVLLATFSLLLYTTFAPAVAALLVCFTKRCNPAQAWDYPYDTYINPPFRSLQSWAALKLFLAVAWVFARKNSAVESLLKCRDWVRVDTQWSLWMPRMCKESLRPLLESFADSHVNLHSIYLVLHDIEEDKAAATYQDVTHLPIPANVTTLGSRMLTALVRLLPSHGERLQPWAEGLRDYLLELFIYAANKAETKEEATYIDETAGYLSFTSIRETRRLDLLRQLHYALCQNALLQSRTWNTCTPSHIWLTFAMILLHPDFPPEDMPEIIADTMDTMGRLPEGLPPSLFRDSFDTYMRENKPVTQKALYYLSRHPNWKDCFLNHSDPPYLATFVDGEEMVRTDFIPPPDWPPVAFRHHRAPSKRSTTSIADRPDSSHTSHEDPAQEDPAPAAQQAIPTVILSPDLVEHLTRALREQQTIIHLPGLGPALPGTSDTSLPHAIIDIGESADATSSLPPIPLTNTDRPSHESVNEDDPA